MIWWRRAAFKIGGSGLAVIGVVAVCAVFYFLCLGIAALGDYFKALGVPSGWR